MPFVELDALNWLPDWLGVNANDSEKLMHSIRSTSDGDGWVVAGSYAGCCEKAFWDRLQTVI